MTLEALIDEVHRRGYFVCNLFELGVEGKPGWQANVATIKRDYEWGTGATAVEALTKALANTTDPGSSLVEHKAALGAKAPAAAEAGVFD